MNRLGCDAEDWGRAGRPGLGRGPRNRGFYRDQTGCEPTADEDKQSIPFLSLSRPGGVQGSARQARVTRRSPTRTMATLSSHRVAPFTTSLSSRPTPSHEWSRSRRDSPSRQSPRPLRRQLRVPKQATVAHQLARRVSATCATPGPGDCVGALADVPGWSLGQLSCWGWGLDLWPSS